MHDGPSISWNFRFVKLDKFEDADPAAEKRHKHDYRSTGILSDGG
jgi:hypothetical protein